VLGGNRKSRERLVQPQSVPKETERIARPGLQELQKKKKNQQKDSQSRGKTRKGSKERTRKLIPGGPAEGRLLKRKKKLQKSAINEENMKTRLQTTGLVG